MGNSDGKTAGVRVSVELDSRHDGRPAERASYAGKLYDKAGVLYLRYDQPVEGGSVATTLRWDGRELRLVRSGAVESAMTFAGGKTSAGTYRTAHGRLEMETATRYVEAAPHGGTAGEAAEAASDRNAADAARFGDAAVPAARSGGFELPLTLAWAYRLTVGGEDAGDFDIRLTIREERQA